jgi:hypothetical protein
MGAFNDWFRYEAVRASAGESVASCHLRPMRNGTGRFEKAWLIMA